MQLAGVFCACLIFASGALALATYIFDKFRTNRHLSRSMLHFLSSLHSAGDEKYALDQLGENSVYHFLLSNNWMAWAVVLFTMAVQIFLLFVFVEGAEINLDDDRSDLVYSFKCPRDRDECYDTSDLTIKGWVSFALLMAAHMSKDIINGVKLILLSAKQRHQFNSRLRFFAGGTLLTAVTCFTLYVSTIYNKAIATSDTEIIINSVVILFICEVAELIFGILKSINPAWVDRLVPSGEEEHSTHNGGLHEKADDRSTGDECVPDESGSENYKHLEEMILDLRAAVESLQTQNAELKSTHTASDEE
jgi:hypothetical protein